MTAASVQSRAGLNWLGRETPNLGEAREALQLINRDVRRAGDVIRSLRAMLTKSDSKRAYFDVNDVIREVLALARSELHKHGVTAVTDLSAEAPPVYGDRVQLMQVMINLVMNAVEAMSGMGDGERELSISTIKDASNSLSVSVRDSGPGLDPKTIDRMFDAFFTTKSKGMGMGLAICHSIIETHGGRLWAGANEPRGATFQFTLPLAAGDTVPPRNAGQMQAI